MIKALQAQIAQHGDLEIFSQEHFAFDDLCVSMYESEPGEFPDDWDMPEKFFVMSDLR